MHVGKLFLPSQDDAIDQSALKSANQDGIVHRADSQHARARVKSGVKVKQSAVEQG